MAKMANDNEALRKYIDHIEGLVSPVSILDSGALRSEIGDVYFDVLMLEELAYGTLTHFGKKQEVEIKDVEDRAKRLKEGEEMIAYLLNGRDVVLSLPARQSLVFTELVRVVALDCLMKHHKQP